MRERKEKREIKGDREREKERDRERMKKLGMDISTSRSRPCEILQQSKKTWSSLSQLELSGRGDLGEHELDKKSI